MKKKLILSNAAIIAAGFIIVFLLTAFNVQNQYRSEFQKRLDTALSILTAQADEISKNPELAATNAGAQLEKVNEKMRISIIDLNGKVIGDSAEEEINQNHSSRKEIIDASKNGRGYDIRISESLNERYYYEAVFVKDKFFIRAALPISDLDKVIGGLWSSAALIMILGILLICIVTSILVYRVTRPLNQLTKTARQIAEANYSSRVVGNYKDEVGQLAASFNTMAESTENFVSQLKGKQNQLEGVLQGMDDGVIAVNSDNEILFSNQSARLILDKPNLVDGSILQGSLSISKISNMMQESIKTSESKKELVSKAPNEGQFNVYVSPVAGQNQKSALAVITDVTRVQKLEQIRSEFVANVTHELKTPLTSIRASIELLKSADRDEKTRKYFYEVLDIEAERLHRLIDDMLVLSQIENTKDDKSACRCNVKEQLINCIDRLTSFAHKNKISLSLEAEDNLYVACSEIRFQQLFENLIENAIKYNKPEGNVIITAVKQKQIAVIKVKDTGIGISKEHFERLFERFYRVDSSRSREIGGTGLGLSIVKHLAALYGGDVGVESEIGNGTTFIVRLPLLSNDV